MNELALFAGVGGGVLGGNLLGWRTVCAVEIDAYCRRVLMQRQNDGVLEPFWVWDDVRTFDGRAWRGRVDVITAGFPCQPFSVAGKQRGADDERNMWPETIRVIREVGPRFVLLENVPGLLANEYFGTILGDLAESGFNARWRVLSAAELGAHFVGERVWIFAEGAAADSLRLQGSGAHKVEKNQWGRNEFEGLVRMEVEHGIPAGSIGRISDGISNRVDRLRSLGNAQVPVMAAAAWRLLSEGR